MTQIVQSSSRDTRTKRMPCVSRLTRTRSERKYSGGAATLTLTDATILDSGIWWNSLDASGRERPCSSTWVTSVSWVALARSHSLRDPRLGFWLPTCEQARVLLL